MVLHFGWAAMLSCIKYLHFYPVRMSLVLTGDQVYKFFKKKKRKRTRKQVFKWFHFIGKVCLDSHNVELWLESQAIPSRIVIPITVSGIALEYHSGTS